MDEANSGWKRRLEKAKLNSDYIKLLFQYPGREKVIVKRGFVLECSDNSFDFNEDIDGEATYSYNYLVEVIVEARR